MDLLPHVARNALRNVAARHYIRAHELNLVQGPKIGLRVSEEHRSNTSTSFGDCIVSPRKRKL